MPTRGRAEFAAEALACFLAQDWAEKELVILDDDDAPSFPNGIVAQGVRYHRQPKATVGAKRNACCRLASGEVIVHFDDDDYSAPQRITEQIDLMFHWQSPFVGFHSMIFKRDDELFQYTGSPQYALGTSFCYRKWLWERTPFDETGFLPDGALVPEDNLFVARNRSALVAVDAGPLMWARIHDGCTSPRKGDGSCWRKL